MTVTPVNHRTQDASDEAVARDVGYALQIADFYVANVPGGAQWLVNRRVLELGPGASLGAAVLLACHGALVTVADRYLAAWDPVYHGAFYRALFCRLRDERPWLDPDPILRLLESDAFVPETVQGLHRGVEDLRDMEDGRFDLVLSNAVFEHVENVPWAFAVLARITRAGGHGVHQVDFRDHRDFDRPLEHLTMPADEFGTLFADVKGECGNRWRPGAMQLEAERVGFEVSAFQENMLADEAYLDDVLPRLHPDYDGLDRDGLRVISGCFVMRRRGALNTEYPVDSDSPQTLAHSRCRYAYVAPYVEGKRVLDVGCGAGLGSRVLMAAGAGEVTGVDVRPEALALARSSDPRGGAPLADAWVQHDLEQGLPFPDQRFDVVVALEVLEHVRHQQQLVDEIRRVLAPDGLAFVSVPHRPFEEFWAELAGESNPYHLHVPDRAEFLELLSGFAAVELAAQLDVVSSLVLPLDELPSSRARGSLEVSGGTRAGDHGTIVIIATAHMSEPSRSERHLPAALGWGNHQESFGEAIQHNQALARYAEVLLYERNQAWNRLRWLELGDAPAALTAPAPAPAHEHPAEDDRDDAQVDAAAAAWVESPTESPTAEPSETPSAAPPAAVDLDASAGSQPA